MFKSLLVNNYIEYKQITFVRGGSSLKTIDFENMTLTDL